MASTKLPDVLMEGHLMKKDSVGFRGFRTWKKFYFVLTKTSLMAYKKKEEVDKVDLDPKDIVNLVDIVSVVHLPEKRTGCRFDITVKLTYDMKKYLVSLDGESVKDTKRWVRRLGRFAAAAKDKQKQQRPDLDILPAAPIGSIPGAVPGALVKRKPSDPDMEDGEEEHEHEEEFPQQPLAFEGEEEEEGKPHNRMSGGVPVWDEGPPGYQEEGRLSQQQQQQQQQQHRISQLPPPQQPQQHRISQPPPSQQQHTVIHTNPNTTNTTNTTYTTNTNTHPQKQQPELPNMSSEDPKQRLNAMLHNLGLSEDEEEPVNTDGGILGEGKPSGSPHNMNYTNNNSSNNNSHNSKGVGIRPLAVVNALGEHLVQDSDDDNQNHHPRPLLSSPVSSPKAARSGRMVSKLSPDETGLKRLFYILDLTAYLPKFVKEEYKLGDLFHMDDDTLTHLIPPAGPRSRLRCYLDDHVWEP